MMEIRVCTSKLDYKADLVQKCMLHDHGVRNGELKSIITGEGAVLLGW
jgi:hypothetical protein